MIVTIDGPAGAGKSSAAKALAGRLGFEFLDTGAMYRAVALAATRAGVALDDHAALEALLVRVRLEMPAGRVVLDGEDVSGLIRTPEVSAGSSVVAASAAVRPRLAALQRRLAEGRDVVCEGRDQGTVVFPDAGCKFFLVADPEERLRRRARELEARGAAVDLDALRRDQAERDRRDAGRQLAPMRPADDAVLLDSTALTLEQVVGRMEQETRRRMAKDRSR
ncbi:MAG: (d)CMP kinase [Gemmataceae bacterium]